MHVLSKVKGRKECKGLELMSLTFVIFVPFVVKNIGPQGVLHHSHFSLATLP